MKHIPILFSTEMVQAILDGRKKMTRRTLHIQPLDDDKWILATLVGGDSKNIGKRHWVTMKDSYTIARYDDRYFEQKYSKGDILWVRESFLWVMNDHCHDMMEGRRFVYNQFVYKASEGKEWFDYAKEKYGYEWKPSIHMPKSACRIFLRVTDVRCERLQDISEQDAVDEGILDIWASSSDGTHAYKNYMHTKKEAMEPCGHWNVVADDAVSSFQSLWAKINGQESWDANPYVWVVSFERCERPDDFI